MEYRVTAEQAPAVISQGSKKNLRHQIIQMKGDTALNCFPQTVGGGLGVGAELNDPTQNRTVENTHSAEFNMWMHDCREKLGGRHSGMQNPEWEQSFFWVKRNVGGYREKST